jgi:hypothetical protein
VNFEFIPFKLNQPIDEFSSEIEFIGEDNGVILYKYLITGKLFDLIPISSINLYFLEGFLITAYINLKNSVSNLEQVVHEIEMLHGQATCYKSNFTTKYIWVVNEEVLVVLKDEINKRLYLYHALKRYSIYTP